MENIADAMSYINELVGTPYVWWHEGMELSAATPFYLAAGPPPPATEVKASGTNCAGFLNLVCRKLDIPIPGLGTPSAGGTYGWFRELDRQGLLVPFNSDPKVGSVLIHDYEDEEEQGHVAIVVAPGIIAHSCAARGVVFEQWSISHDWSPKGYYTHMWVPAAAV